MSVLMCKMWAPLRLRIPRLGRFTRVLGTSSQMRRIRQGILSKFQAELLVTPRNEK